jgi:hypothetical protein
MVGNPCLLLTHVAFVLKMVPAAYVCTQDQLQHNMVYSPEATITHETLASYTWVLENLRYLLILSLEGGRSAIKCKDWWLPDLCAVQ